jgi:ATP/maltotriose-dependent transcriptional regulator MalT
MTDTKAHNIEIIRTKLYQPKVPADHVHRAHFIELLDQGEELLLTLVSPPPDMEKAHS